jgi:hypothetical protein
MVVEDEAAVDDRVVVVLAQDNCRDIVEHPHLDLGIVVQAVVVTVGQAGDGDGDGDGDGESVLSTSVPPFVTSCTELTDRPGKCEVRPPSVPRSDRRLQRALCSRMAIGLQVTRTARAAGPRLWSRAGATPPVTVMWCLTVPKPIGPHILPGTLNRSLCRFRIIRPPEIYPNFHKF